MKNKMLTALLVTAAVIVTACGLQQATGTQLTITEFQLPKIDSSPFDITAGPDGNLWFTEQHNNSIGRITPQGTITESPLPPLSGTVRITAGPDGNLWFTEDDGVSFGRITPTGMITELPLASPFTSILGITFGPDGNLWFTDRVGGNIGRFNGRTMTAFSLAPQYTEPVDITAGPDGNLWFTECFFVLDTDQCSDGQIGRITPTGQITTFPVFGDSDPEAITTGPDGNLWFTDCVQPIPKNSRCTNSEIGRMTPQGDIKKFPLPNGNFNLQLGGITVGPDGNLWFTEYASNSIGRITPTGQITEFPLPNPDSSPLGITKGPDGNLWFTEYMSGKIGRITFGK